MAKFYQISVLGGEPSGGLFIDRKDAQREVRLLKADDARHSYDAFKEAGVVVECPEYEIHEVDVTL